MNEEGPKTPSLDRKLLLRVFLGVAGILLVLGFFLPWVSIGDVANIAGHELVFGDNLPSWQRVALAFCPLLGALSVAVAILGFRWARWFALGVGGVVLGYGLFTVSYLLFKMLSVGLWLVLAGGLLALAAGFLLRPRRRASEPEAEPPKGQDEEEAP